MKYPGPALVMAFCLASCGAGESPPGPAANDGASDLTPVAADATDGPRESDVPAALPLPTDAGSDTWGGPDVLAALDAVTDAGADASPADTALDAGTDTGSAADAGADARNADAGADAAPDVATCGAGYEPGVGGCVLACATRTTCAATGASCGVIVDGCGGTLACGTCGEDARCGRVLPARCAPTLAAPVTVADLPAALGGMAAVVGADGNLYAFGGTTPSRTISDGAYRYEVVTNAWTTLARMPRQRRAAVAGAGPDGRIYVIGGNWTGTREVDVYDPATNTWTRGAPSPLPVDGAAAVTLPNGRIYVLGGQDPSSAVPFPTVQVFDPAMSSWSLGPDMSTPRVELAAAVSPDGLIYAAGGSSGTANLNSVEVLDPRTGRWSPVAPLPSGGGRRRLGAAFGIDGNLYVVGGVGLFGNAVGDVPVFDPLANRWTAIGAASYAFDVAVVRARDGRIFAIGGSTGPEGGASEASAMPTNAVTALNTTTLVWN
ncbi:MAG: hypothetical protein JWM10_5070 [Myxococcaceae bacterium]|nr:hypothetical protein [Myxococcaceae bacterium]